MHTYFSRIIVATYILVLTQFAHAESISVKVANLSDIASYPERTAPATVISLNDSTISSEINAKVISFPTRVGDIVEKNKTLVSLNCTDYELSKRQAESSLESIEARLLFAQNRLARTEKLVLNQTVSEEAFDERSTDLSVLQSDKIAAKASLESARLNVSRCHIVSPFRALVVERISAVGEFANIGLPLVRLLDLSSIEISAQVSTEEIVQIESASTFAFEYSGQRYPVRIRTILPTINSETRNREVRLLFKDNSALTGAAGKLIWNDRRPHIPANLVVRREEKFGIFIEEKGTAIFVPIANAMAGRSTPVSLSDDTHLIIEGHFTVQDKTPVHITE